MRVFCRGPGFLWAHLHVCQQQNVRAWPAALGRGQPPKSLWGWRKQGQGWVKDWTKEVLSKKAGRGDKDPNMVRAEVTFAAVF